MPVKFGISFTTSWLNQGNALVSLQVDGTVQVSTGGTEMGQGLNVKIRQLVADEFGIPPEHVLVMATSTEKNHNTSATAASAGTDLNGAAAVEGCRQIKERLTAYAARRLARPDIGYGESPSNRSCSKTARFTTAAIPKKNSNSKSSAPKPAWPASTWAPAASTPRQASITTATPAAAIRFCITRKAPPPPK